MWLRKKRAADAAPAEASPATGITIMRSPGDPSCDDMFDALQARDWGTARHYLVNAPNAEIFADRLLAAADVEGLETWIDDVIRDEPDATLPLLVKGARYTHWAWEARGGGWAKDVPDHVWPVWFDRLRQAEDALDEVVDREPGNAEAWHWLIVLARARQLPKEELWRRYRALVAADPTNYYGHTQMLEGLKKKWSGSHEAMLEFARTTAQAHPGTHLPVILAMAHWELSHDHDDRWAYMKSVGDEVWAAAYGSLFHPNYKASHFTSHVGNWLALLLMYCGFLEASEECFDMLGDRFVTHMPWAYWGDPVERYNLTQDIVRSNLARHRAQGTVGPKEQRP
jgi:hypothetical protein